MVSDFGDERVGVLVYKILPESDWQEACRLGKYFGSQDDLRDGSSTSPLDIRWLEQLRAISEG